MEQSTLTFTDYLRAVHEGSGDPALLKAVAEIERLEVSLSSRMSERADLTAKLGRLRDRVNGLANAIDELHKEGKTPVDTALFDVVVQLVAEARGAIFDDLHHAPMCQANHYHYRRVPGWCTCGARKAAGMGSDPGATRNVQEA